MKKSAYIGRMRTRVSSLLKEHPELKEIVREVNEELWALELALEIEEKGGALA